MKLIQVFDYNGMPNHLSDRFVDDYEVNNDSYVRWYPNYRVREYHEELNSWLVQQGMQAESDPRFFYVLIHVHW